MTKLPLVHSEAPQAQLSVAAGSGAQVRRSVLPGGIRVLTEAMPGQRSATIGAWVAVGSRDESEGHHGSTHFLEHLLFKGTPSRDALAIAAAFDEVGGEANAATGKEHTCFFARVLDDDLAMATDVIIDMLTAATLDEGEFASERGVILEELAMSQDDPIEVAHEQFFGQVFGGHPLGRPIGGTPASIRNLARDDVYQHYRSTYAPDELVVAAAGGVDHDRLCRRVLAGVRRSDWSLSAGALPVDRRRSGRAFTGQDASSTGMPGGSSSYTVRRDGEQAGVLLGGLGPGGADERRFTLSVLNAVLGGSMSSRLFQEIREKRGLAYAVYSFGATFADSGAFGLYAGCAPENVAQVVQLLHEQWRLLAEEPISAEELQRGIGQMSGGLVLGLEDTGSRMSRLGRSEITTGEFLTVDQTLERLQAVSAEDIRALAADLYAQSRHLTVVGPFEEDVAAAALPTH